jgi:hypothetical protein
MHSLDTTCKSCKGSKFLLIDDLKVVYILKISMYIRKLGRHGLLTISERSLNFHGCVHFRTDSVQILNLLFLLSNEMEDPCGISAESVRKVYTYENSHFAQIPLKNPGGPKSMGILQLFYLEKCCN